MGVPGKGCAAFSVSLKGGLPQCRLFSGAVPARLCGSDDYKGACAFESEGSYRLKYVYTGAPDY